MLRPSADCCGWGARTFSSVAVAGLSSTLARSQLSRIRLFRVSTKPRKLWSSSSTMPWRRSVAAVTRFTRTCSSGEARRLDIASRPIAPSTRTAIGAASMIATRRSYPRRMPDGCRSDARVSAVADKERGHGGGQFVRVERLGDEGRRAGLSSLLLVGLGGERRDDDAAGVLKRGVGCEMADDVEAGSSRHHQIDEHDVGPEAVRHLDRLGDGLGLLEFVVTYQGNAHELAECGLIVADQDPRGLHPPLTPPGGRRAGSGTAACGAAR